MRDIEALKGERFDVVVIGGGITGATAAWDAALRGLKVALIDKSDFGGATSAATSKLIHGGLRYLKQAEFRLVRESLRERRILQKIAGHLVKPIPFLIPTYRHANRKAAVRLGMILYDALSYDRARLEDPEQRIPRHEMLDTDEVASMEPELPLGRVTGAALYYDCRCEPERLTLEFILAAQQAGATVANYVKASDLVCRVGRIDAVEAHDLLGGDKFEIPCRMVVNAGGPWADELEVLCGASEQVVQIKRSKGIHIVTRPLTRRHAVVLPTPDGHHLFIIPWRGHSLIGTTDTEYLGHPDDLSVDDQEVESFVATVNEVFPPAKLKTHAVKYRYGGVRPLVEQTGQVYTSSRRYQIVDHHSRGTRGLITATGGKYTTSRSLAQKLVNIVLARLGEPKIACRTHDTLLPGAVRGPFGQYVSSRLEEANQRLERKQLRHLLETYGARYQDVLQMANGRPELLEPIVENRPECLAQVAFAVEYEMAQTLCDVLFRRTGLCTLGDPGDEALDKVAGMMGQKLGWSASRKRAEIQACRNKLRGLPERLVEAVQGS
ncbi:MAG: glycerol-3-phosphate dehydrogenase/oxidase [Deltaproteobacteria bacterium]|nr:MAG: glycerol-3-phosphate dehydrogenase/oxidase [Deltaproteobacteria bacterium]